jgi:AbrB family looped-hinge helix DNA binding protein
MISTLSSKGQITLPKAIRDRLDLQTGDKLEFFGDKEGHVKMVPVTAPVTQLKGMVPKPAKPKSLQDLQLAIERRGEKE